MVSDRKRKEENRERMKDREEDEQQSDTDSEHTSCGFVLAHHIFFFLRK